MDTDRKELKLIVACFYLAVFVTCGIFFFSQLREASLKPLWGDEIFGLERTIPNLHYQQMVIYGAKGQGSPAPLFYILGKALDAA